MTITRSFSLQCSVLRTSSGHPYDISAWTLMSLMSYSGSSDVVAARIREEIQAKVQEAGLEILEARITHLAYASEIAAAMLQRQQASAIIDARKMIVEGAVGTVEMALERLNQSGVVELDEERKAAMVSNLLVVLCGNHEAQPVVNTGSLY
ncbi:MAG: SPFH domain-containing protein [Evtepia gabavorous]